MSNTSVLTGKASDFLKIGVNAAGRGDLPTLKAVLAERPLWRTRVGSHGRTMLWEAAYRGRLNVVNYLLETYEDIDIEARGCYYTPMLVEVSPLCASILKNRKPVTDRLLEAGAVHDVVTATYLGEHIKLKDLLRENPSLVQEQFLQHDPHFDATLLHYAVAANHFYIAEMLIVLGADVEPYSDHLVRFSVGHGNVELVKLLLETGVDVSQKTYLRGEIDSDELVAVLKRHGATIEIDAIENGWPSLVYTCRGDRGGNIESVRELLDLGADVNVRNYKGQSALHCAAKAGFHEPVALLIEHAAEVNAQDRDGDTPLHAACRSSIKDQSKLQKVIDLLLEAGADPNRRNRLGRTPLQVMKRKSSLILN